MWFILFIQLKPESLITSHAMPRKAMSTDEITYDYSMRDLRVLYGLSLMSRRLISLIENELPVSC